MMKNKKGQAIFVGFMLFVTVFIIAINFIPVLKPEIVRVRGVGYLDCSNAANSTGIKMLCIVVDVYLFYFIATVLGAAAVFITGKKLTTG